MPATPHQEQEPGGRQHWEAIYTTRDPSQMSWFQPRAQLSLELIGRAGAGSSAAIIDVGGGASTLVDDLVASGHTGVSVLDLSGAALALGRSRLGSLASRVRWLEADVLSVDLERQAYDVWHDRAVFHFLTSEADRQRYVDVVLHAVRPGGIVIVATFAEDGPESCSGLPVRRYDPAGLHAEFGEPFLLLGHERERHGTPSGGEQRFVYCFCRRLAGPDGQHPAPLPNSDQATSSWSWAKR